MSATGLGTVDPTVAHIPCQDCAETIGCIVNTVLWPILTDGKVTAVEVRPHLDTTPLYDHHLLKHVQDLFDGAGL